MNVSIYRISIFSLFLISISPIVAIMPVFPGDDILFCIIVSFLTAVYYGSITLWARSLVRFSAGSMGCIWNFAFFFVPVVFFLHKYMLRFHDFNYEYGGKFGDIVQILVSINLLVYVSLCFKAARDLEEACGGSGNGGMKLFRSASAIMFLPIGIWYLRPKILKLFEMRDAISRNNVSIADIF